MTYVNGVAKREQLCKPVISCLRVPASLRHALSPPCHLAPPGKESVFQGVCVEDGAGTYHPRYTAG